MIKVNKEVANILKRIRYSDGNSVAYKLYRFLHELREDNNIMQDWLDKNNITITDLLTIFTDGYEEIYEFKVGDIIIDDGGILYIITDEKPRYNTIALATVKTKSEFVEFKLVCKAEDRFDLKEESE